MLVSLFSFLRDIALLAAALGVVWWCWDQYARGDQRRDDAARSDLAAERRAVELSKTIERIDERTAAAVVRLDEIAAAWRADEIRLASRLRVHRLLQATSDPFLTFAEIERALGQVGRFAGALADDEPAAQEPSERLAGDDLRRALMELVRDGIVAQLDRDRYFIASDYEAGEGDVEGGPE